jgi:hypothetical protein
MVVQETLQYSITGSFYSTVVHYTTLHYSTQCVVGGRKHVTPSGSANRERRDESVSSLVFLVCLLPSIIRTDGRTDSPFRGAAQTGTYWYRTVRSGEASLPVPIDYRLAHIRRLAYVCCTVGICTVGYKWKTCRFMGETRR